MRRKKEDTVSLNKSYDMWHKPASMQMQQAVAKTYAQTSGVSDCPGDKILYGGNQYFQHNYCSFLPPLRTEICISPHAPSRKCQITARYTGHTRNVDGTCSMSPSWHQEFRSDIYMFGKFVKPGQMNVDVTWKTGT